MWQPYPSFILLCFNCLHLASWDALSFEARIFNWEISLSWFISRWTRIDRRALGRNLVWMLKSECLCHHYVSYFIQSMCAAKRLIDGWMPYYWLKLVDSSLLKHVIFYFKGRNILHILLNSCPKWPGMWSTWVKMDVFNSSFVVLIAGQALSMFCLVAACRTLEHTWGSRG